MKVTLCCVLLMACLVLGGQAAILANGLAQADINSILTQHNNVRANASPTPASAMVQLVWSTVLAGIAQGYSDQCNFVHNVNRGPYGENILWNGLGGDSGTKDFKTLINQWSSEVSSYTYSSNTCAVNETCGHYTQMVWAQTFEVGCGWTVCSPLGSSGYDGPATFLVCDYNSPGNYVGCWPYKTGAAYPPPQNYPPPLAASAGGEPAGPPASPTSSPTSFPSSQVAASVSSPSVSVVASMISTDCAVIGCPTGYYCSNHACTPSQTNNAAINSIGDWTVLTGSSTDWTVVSNLLNMINTADGSVVRRIDWTGSSSLSSQAYTKFTLDFVGAQTSTVGLGLRTIQPTHGTTDAIIWKFIPNGGTASIVFCLIYYGTEQSCSTLTTVTWNTGANAQNTVAVSASLSSDNTIQMQPFVNGVAAFNGWYGTNLQYYPAVGDASIYIQGTDSIVMSNALLQTATTLNVKLTSCLTNAQWQSLVCTTLNIASASCAASVTTRALGSNANCNNARVKREATPTFTNFQTTLFSTSSQTSDSLAAQLQASGVAAQAVEVPYANPLNGVPGTVAPAPSAGGGGGGGGGGLSDGAIAGITVGTTVGGSLIILAVLAGGAAIAYKVLSKKDNDKYSGAGASGDSSKPGRRTEFFQNNPDAVDIHAMEDKKGHQSITVRAPGQ